MAGYIDLKDYGARKGQAVGTSRWFEIDQKRINEFAEVTEDRQFIHVDPEEAAKTPFRGTIAHGFLTLSMLLPMAVDALPGINGRIMSVNYGFDKIRFVTPVPSGSKIRAHFKLVDVTPRSPREFLTRSEVSVEIQGIEKPALIAEWLGIAHFAEPMEI